MKAGCDDGDWLAPVHITVQNHYYCQGQAYFDAPTVCNAEARAADSERSGLDHSPFKAIEAGVPHSWYIKMEEWKRRQP